ncbi:heat shock factor 2-binding protein-like [Sycon ciliatum]|uniref:heat shock factor 2-binding protein-like n=1 Tax=Sycon ciliatum TaxID=27933 RepID=UPI0031F666B7
MDDAEFTYTCEQSNDLSSANNLIERLTVQVKQMKEYLPKIMSPEVVSGYAKGLDLDEECNAMKVAISNQQKQESLLHRKCDSLMAAAEQDKKECIQLKQEVASMNELLAEQASFCSTVGATTCNLLWKMSHCTGAVDSILTGNMLVSFLQLASSSMEGFLETCDNLVTEDSAEVNFILSICGVLTNIFATPSGRDYLVTSGYGTALVDQYITVLKKAVKGERLRNIVLMAIYNISISQPGLEMILSRPGLVPALAHILTSTSMSGNHLQALKLLQSISAECQMSYNAREAMDQVSEKLIRKFAKDSNMEVRTVVRDILADLQHWQQREP